MEGFELVVKGIIENNQEAIKGIILVASITTPTLIIVKLIKGIIKRIS